MIMSGEACRIFSLGLVPSTIAIAITHAFFAATAFAQLSPMYKRPRRLERTPEQPRLFERFLRLV
jgi:hypothetical protein